MLGNNQALFIHQVDRIEQVTQGCLPADQNPGSCVQNIAGHGQVLGHVIECFKTQGELVVQLPGNQGGNRFHLVTGLLFQLRTAKQETGDGYQQGCQDDRDNHQRNGPIRQAAQPSLDQHDIQTPQRVRQPVMI